MSVVKNVLTPFFGAFLVCPTFILLHECGHYAATRWLGFDAHIHFAEVVSLSQHSFSKTDDLIITIAGPLVNLILAMAGFFWLRRLKKQRLGVELTFQDWLAVILTMNALRWLRGLGIPLGFSHLTDEMIFSQGVGLPRWLLPVFLGIISLPMLIAIVWFLPRGNRLFSILSLLSGGILGVFVWMKFVGPQLFP
jgi:hypothetical protein